MKIGLIFECGPRGADKQVCEEIISKWARGVTTFQSITLDNKPRLIASCGAAAAQLLGEGCDRVLIIWDLFPAWREPREKPCRKSDRKEIMDSVRAAGTKKLSRVAMICIEEELEAWLIADGRALSTVLSTPAHPVRIADAKRPQQIKNPKKKLNQEFKKHRGIPYNDLYHAIKIVQAMPDRKKMERVPSFQRFMEKVAG